MRRIVLAGILGLVGLDAGRAEACPAFEQCQQDCWEARQQNEGLCHELFDDCVENGSCDYACCQSRRSDCFGRVDGIYYDCTQGTCNANYERLCPPPPPPPPPQCGSGGFGDECFGDDYCGCEYWCMPYCYYSEEWGYSGCCINW